VETEPAAAMLRIGELSRRLGVSEHVLRAWERRYGLLEPARSSGGFRLYSAADVDRVRRMQANLASGLSAAEAARAVLAEPEPVAAQYVHTGATQGRQADTAAVLSQALDAMDEPAAQRALDRLFSDFTVEAVLRDVVVPYLWDLGERWQHGRASVAEEHFASNLLRGRLANLARGWGQGRGPQALLACPPDELHDLPLLAFGIVLHRNGWRVSYLGANTPIEDLARAVAELRPELVVLAAVTPERFDGMDTQLSQLTRVAPLALAGAGATSTMAQAIGARVLRGDPVTEAERMPLTHRQARADSG
jgi:DNA-binding transcriptional MerR regulator